MTRQIIHVETDKNTPITWNLLNPHYSDGRFHNNEQTIFLAPGNELISSFGSDIVVGVNYVYSDQLYEWDYKKSQESFQEASKNFPEGTPALYEDYLRRYYNNPALQLVHIIAGINRGNGYPYRIYGHISHRKE